MVMVRTIYSVTRSVGVSAASHFDYGDVENEICERCPVFISVVSTELCSTMPISTSDIYSAVLLLK